MPTVDPPSRAPRDPRPPLERRDGGGGGARHRGAPPPPHLGLRRVPGRGGGGKGGGKGKGHVNGRGANKGKGRGRGEAGPGRGGRDPSPRGGRVTLQCWTKSWTGICNVRPPPPGGGGPGPRPEAPLPDPRLIEAVTAVVVEAFRRQGASVDLTLNAESESKKKSSQSAFNWAGKYRPHPNYGV